MTSLLDKLNTADAPETELVETCPLCKSAESRFLFWNFDRLHHLPGKFGVVQCKNCHLARLSPRPLKKNLGYYYPEDGYYSYQEISTENTSQSFAGKIRESIRRLVFADLNYPVSELTTLEKVLQPAVVKLFKPRATFGWNERFPRYVSGGKALDVGCGNGAFLNVLKQLGWEVRGIEMSSKAAQVAKTAFDIDVFSGEIEDAPFEADSFDYIHINHVIEHFVDPIAELRHSAKFLKPGGIMYIEAPNIESFGCKKSGEYWLHWDSPRHLIGFSPKTLEQTVSEAGLKVVKTKTFTVNFWQWETTYKMEESRGEMLKVRPYSSQTEKLRAVWLQSLANINHYLNSDSGDYVGCWATKE